MALTFTFLDSGGGEPPLVTDSSYNPAASAALAVAVAINGSTGAQINNPTGCKATWTRKAEFTMGDWGCAVFVGTGATTNQAISFSTSGDSFGFQYMVDQIVADGTLSFPANDNEATGTGATGLVTLSTFANSANRSLSFWFIETADGTTPGTNHTELFDSFLIGHQGFSQYSTSNDVSVDCTFTSGTWGGGAFEVAETATGVTLTADNGSYVLNGQTANLVYAAGSTLPAESGSYTLLGSDGYRDISSSAELGSYALNGQDAVIFPGFKVTAEQGSYALNGFALLFHRSAASDFGSYVLTGRPANLLAPDADNLQSGSYVLNGWAVGLIWSGATGGAGSRLMNTRRRFYGYRLSR